jgi:bifunctional non-homologous end joining protein LigD
MKKGEYPPEQGFIKSPMPEKVKPMLAFLTEEPFDDNNWVFELKLDGYRVISLVNKGKVNLFSRNGKSFNTVFDTFRKELLKPGHNVVVDGEVVAVDKKGRPVFQLLQNYSKTGKGEIVYYVFDLLWFDGYDLKQLPLLDRKKILKSVIGGLNNIYYSDHITGKGKKLFEKAEKLGFEGIIAKKADSVYSENTRSKSWLKVKFTNTIDAVICGYTEPRGSRKYFGSLVLGVYDKKKLIYIGHTGTGFDYMTQKSVYTQLQKYRTGNSPFTVTPKTNMPAKWLKPALVCEVKYSHFTEDRVLRHPVFIRMRDDKKHHEALLKQ